MSGGAPREDEAKALVRRLIDSVFNARDSGALAELAQDAEGAWRSAVGVLVELAAFPDYVLAVDDLIREGDRVAARITVRGTHAGRLGAFPPSGRPVTATMIAVFHVSGGKIVDGWHSWDRGSAAGQLDAIPEPVLELADIQGNIVPGFRKDHSALLFLRIGDVDAARPWLGKLASIVATADEVLAFNRLFSAARRRRRFEGALRATWVNVAFTAPGLARLVPDAALVWPGEFVFGYPRQDPYDPSKPGQVADGGPSWTRNGSLLVFRRYRQDVSRFRDFLASTAHALSGGAGDVSPDLAAAKLVGRWRSGAPIVRAADADDPELAASDCAANNFAYATARPPIPPGPPDTCADPWPPAPADPRGVLCPHGGHIRKSYPRDEVPGAQSHRLLRRGA